MALSDVHKYPFSLFNEAKRDGSGGQIDKVGNVTEALDKSIGRNVYRIKGAVSANNYIDFTNLHLEGKHLCLQLCLFKSTVATLHLELVTTKDVSLRVTISTLYDHPRFLGRSLRLPLPIKTEWSNLVIDIDEILSSNCPQTFGRLKCIKRVQLCSNMAIRDFVTNNIPFESNSHIKELAAISSAKIGWINLSDSGPGSSESPVSSSPATTTELLKRVTMGSISHEQAWGVSPPRIKSKQMVTENSESPEAEKKDSPKKLPSTPGLASRQPYPISDPETPDLLNFETRSPETVRDIFDPSGKFEDRSSGFPHRSRIATPKVTPHRVSGELTGHRSNIINPVVKVTSPTERVVGLERVLGYHGGPTVSLYNGEMLAVPCGSIIVLLDIRAKDALEGLQPPFRREKYGLWKAFKFSTNGRYEMDHYPQAYLKGHTSKVILIEVSLDGRLMATCEEGPKARLFLWDLQEGKRLAVLQPHAESVHTVCFSPESALLCTSGWDHVRREQIVIWHIPTLVQMSSEQTSKESQQSLVMARQLSDFHISKIMFSPFFEDGLVSCGRENIRFWRMKKGHLPGRPVQLNEFSRGYFFTDLAYANAPPVGQEQGNILEPCVFVASSMGLLLRVDCRLEQVVCAYQLHNGPIRSLAINGSFAVTGGDDCRMRIWPLHFTDFLMEAHHEAPVTHTVVSQNNRFLTVGTASGTLGVLDVLDHRYWTVLRSHVGPVTCLSTRPPVGEEFMTLGSDHTIRLWDLVSGQQKFEFDSPQDTPLCGSYHPFAHILACGFSSGTLRVFDVQTTSTLFERSPEASLSSPIVRLVFSHANSTSADLSFSSQVRLYSLSLSGKLTAYDTNNNYLPVRTISIAGNPWDSISMNDDIKSRSASMIHLSLSKDNQFLAASCGSIGSLTIFDTTELVPIHRGTTFKKNLSMNTGYLGNDTQSLYSSSTHAQFSMTNIGNPATHVKGLLFFMEKSDRAVMGDENTLLIVTDKHFITISIPVQLNESPRTAAVLESSYAVTLTSDDVCWRRIEGGVRPVSGVITRDHPTGLVFMSIRRSGTEHHAEESQLTPLSGDALAVIGVSCKRTRDPKSLRLISRLNITPMQVITDLPGDKNILYLTPCGPASNKILASDQSGCISVWYLREDRIEQLKSHSLSHVTDSPIEEYSEASRWEAPLEMENRDKEKESLEQIDLANEFEFESENNPTDNNGDTGELKISELEQEVAKTKVEAVETLFDDVENIPQHYRSNQAKSSNSNSDNSTAKKITEMISSRLQQRKKRNSEPSSLKSCGINSGTESRDSTETNTNTNPLGATEAEEDQEWDLVDPKLCQFTAQQLPSLQRIQIKNRMPGRLLVQNCLISPAFCDSSRLLVTSNESEIFIENVDSHSDYSLLGYELLNGTGTYSSRVREVAISPDGQFVASIISFIHPQDMSHSSSSCELHVWRMNTSGWSHLEAVSLTSTLKERDTNSGPLLDWTDKNSLVLLVPVVIPPSAIERLGGLHQFGTSTHGFLLSNTPWGEDSGSTFHIDMPGMPLIFPSSNPVEVVKFLSMWNGPGDCALLLKSKSKIGLYVVDSNKNDVLYPQWISDSGPAGPYLSMHVAHYNHIKYIRGDDVRANDYPECAISTATYSHGHSYQESLQGKYKKGVGLAHSSCECAPDKVFENFPLLVVLDSLGGISCSRLVMSPSPISCSAKVAASHISGAPRILALSSCGMFLALGSSSMVQLFSIKVKDSPNSRFSVNLVLLSRFNFPFSLDHLFFTHPRSSSKPRNDLSSYELLAIDVAGNVGYCPVTICPYGFRIHPLGCNLSKKIATPPKMVRSALNMNRIDVVQSIRANGNLAVCLLDEKSGSLSLVHATNGQSIQLPKNPTGIHSCSCFATYGGILACASRCGRITFYSTETMELLLVTPPVRSMLSNSLKHANVIQSLTFLYGGQRIIAHHHDRSFTLFELRPSEPLKSCPIKVKRLPEIQNSVEVIAIGYDDSMFAIRQDHILSFYLITESMESIEAIHTLTLSLLTQMWPLNQSTKIDLREEDMTSRARVSRYLEINKPLSISPSRVLITRAITGSLYITILGNIGSPVSAQSNQCVLASSFDISSAIRNSQTELYLHTCYSVGLVLSSAANNGYLAILDVDNILHVINTSILQPKLDYLIEELSSLAKSTLPSHQEDLDIWENVKFIRQSLFVAQEVYFHQELLKSCVGSFQMTKNSQDILKYALHVSPKYLVEEKEKVSIFISRSERGNSTGQSIYEVIV